MPAIAPPAHCATYPHGLAIEEFSAIVKLVKQLCINMFPDNEGVDVCAEGMNEPWFAARLRMFVLLLHFLACF